MLSIVIPTLNEEQYIRQLLEVLNCKAHDWMEIVVVDGGSSDQTKDIIQQEYPEVLLLNSDRGRAKQMNVGAKVATYSHLLFMHADSEIDSNFVKGLASVITNADAGAFTLKFDENSLWLRIYEWFAKWNWTAFTYGDQGLLIRTSLFQELKGFKEMPLLEDLDLVHRIKKHASFKKFNLQIVTSSRRFKKNGYVIQQLINIVIVIGFFLGVKPIFLARFYRY